MAKQHICDLLIVGGGPAGLAAAIYAGRARVDTVLVERLLPGGQAATTYSIENYPGFPQGGISGPELMEKFKNQAEEFEVTFKSQDIKHLTIKEGLIVALGPSGEITARSVIIATGAEPRKLGVPGEDELRGKGVSYCATCDGPFFRDKHVAVIGGGDTALEEAEFLTRFVDKVTVIHRRDQLRATKILQERARKNEKIEFIWDTIVTEVRGEDAVEGLSIKNKRTAEEGMLACDGIFLAIGQIPASALVADLVQLDQRGYIITNEKMATSQAGIFAAGDVRQKPLRQVLTAAADGAIAAVSASEYLVAQAE